MSDKLQKAAWDALNALLRVQPQVRGAIPQQDVEDAIDDLRAALAEPVQEPMAALLRAAGRVLQAFDEGYLEPGLETLQGGLAVDALRKAWGAFAPARIQGEQR